MTTCDDESVASDFQSSVQSAPPGRISPPPPPESPTLDQCLYGISAQHKIASFDDDSDHHHHHHEEQAMIDWKEHTSHEISLPQLRKFASQGIPDEGSHRGVVWRVLLGYLPSQLSQWQNVLEPKRGLYLSFVQDLFTNTHDACHGEELRGRRGRRRILENEEGVEVQDVLLEQQQKSDEEPLPVSVKEAWKKRGRDLHILENLTKDMNALNLKETLTLHREEEETKDNNAEPEEKPKDQPAKDDPTTENNKEQEGHEVVIDVKEEEQDVQEIPQTDDSEDMSEVELSATDEEDTTWNDFIESALLLDEVRKDVQRTHPDLAFFLDPEQNRGRRRYAAIERILFVWAKYNRGVKYVQGMNEIVGTLYYVLANDTNEEWAANAEADTYWLLGILLSDFRDVFVPDLDDADTGIQGMIGNMQELLTRHDPEVKDHLEEVGIDPSFYAIRWWTTLLSREFLLPDTIRLWDSLVSSTHRDNFLRYVCVTMVMLIREDLLKGDFSTCLRLLQSYPSVHLDDLLESSRALWIFESQVTIACHKGGISLHAALQAISAPPSIIMAFGLRKGTPLTPVEQLERAGEKAAAQLERAGEKATAQLERAGEKYSAQLEQASEKAAAGLKEATSVMHQSATNLFGRASRLYTKYRLSRSRSADSITDANKVDEHLRRSTSSSSSLDRKREGESKEEPEPGAEALSLDSEEDDIYLNAILNA